MLSYLSDRWQRTKINTSFSTSSELLVGVPQGSVLGPIFLNIYINDLFFVLKETVKMIQLLLCVMKCLHSVATRLEHDSLEAIIWFENNYMKLNTGKCHLLISCNK